MKKVIISVLILVVAISCVFAFTACADKYDYKIGVQSGTTGELYVKGDADWGFTGFSNIECKLYSNGGLAVQDMLNGQIDFVVIDEAPAKQLVASKEGQIKVIDIALTQEEYAFAVDKNQPALLAEVNEFLAAIKANGTFEAILDKYFSGEGEIVGVESAAYDSATNAAFAPFEYFIGNKFAGIDIEIAALLAEELNMELVIQDMDFDAVVSSVGANGVDMAMAGLTVNAEREKVVNFADAYYNASQMLIVKADNTQFDACTTAAEVEAILKKAA